MALCLNINFWLPGFDDFLMKVKSLRLRTLLESMTSILNAFKVVVNARMDISNMCKCFINLEFVFEEVFREVAFGEL